MREGFDEPTFAARIQELANRIRADYSADPNKPFTMQQFETALSSQVNLRGITVYGLTQFVRERRVYLRPLLDSMAQPSDARLDGIVTLDTGSVRDEAGDADSWVELYNLGPRPVNTGGFYLTDDHANPTKWKVPDGFVSRLPEACALRGRNSRVSRNGGSLCLFAGTAARRWKASSARSVERRWPVLPGLRRALSRLPRHPPPAPA